MSWADDRGLRVNKLWNALRDRIQRCRNRGRKKRSAQRRAK